MRHGARANHPETAPDGAHWNTCARAGACPLPPPNQLPIKSNETELNDQPSIAVALLLLLLLLLLPLFLFLVPMQWILRYMETILISDSTPRAGIHNWTQCLSWQRCSGCLSLFSVCCRFS